MIHNTQSGLCVMCICLFVVCLNQFDCKIKEGIQWKNKQEADA